MPKTTIPYQGYKGHTYEARIYEQELHNGAWQPIAYVGAYRWETKEERDADIVNRFSNGYEVLGGYEGDLTLALENHQRRGFPPRRTVVFYHEEGS